MPRWVGWAAKDTILRGNYFSPGIPTGFSIPGNLLWDRLFLPPDFDTRWYGAGDQGFVFFGSEADLRDITVKDVKDFYSTFYTPNNAVLSMVGNIDKRKTEEDIRKYFETIPKGKDIPPLSSQNKPEKKAVVKIQKDSFAASPGF